MNDLGPLIALMREVTGPEVSDGKLTVLVTLVVSFMGRKGGRPRKPDEHQIDVTKPVTPETQTGLQTSTNGGLGGSFSVSDPIPGSDPSKPKTRRRYNSMSLPEGFSEFWHLYPRRVCKLAAIAAWERINPDINLRVAILAALRWQATEVFAKREEEKIPHPATWLNGKRWEDERPKANGSHGPQYKRLDVPKPGLDAYCDWHREPGHDDAVSKRPRLLCPSCKHLAAKNSGRPSNGVAAVSNLDDPLPDWAERGSR